MRTWGQYIGGIWEPGGKMRPIYRPFDGGVCGVTTVSTLADAERAVAAATRAFPLTAALSSDDRFRILNAIHDGIAARRSEFADTIVAEAAKPIRDARVEVERALLVFSLAAEEARRLGGDVLPLDINPASRGRIGITRRFPAGPVAAFTPFNFPLNLVAHKIAPGIAAGCPIVLKPAEKTPLTALLLAQVISESDWPAEALSVLTPEEPTEIGTFLASDDRLPVLSFTGSDKVGWHLKSLADRKRVLLELGGNAAVIVHEDADLSYSAARCASGAFAYSGQVCISVQRIFVHQAIYLEWTECFLAKSRTLIFGDPAQDHTDFGPMISDAGCAKVAEMISEAVRAGARLRLGGEPPERNVLLPTVLTNTRPDMAVRREEAFGPLVCVEPYDSFEEALALANEGPFGLQAGIFTQDVGRIFRAFAALEVGGVIANDVPQYRVDNMPYGGEKNSGFGREGVRYAIEEMTTLRLLALNLTPDAPAR
jgi:acyl-CoA reductase-like NAD-dependent aldehyde dehydrogenase